MSEGVQQRSAQPSFVSRNDITLRLHVAEDSARESLPTRASPENTQSQMPLVLASPHVHGTPIR
jgi:hypothetical protein